jgi:hypothetical protein
LLKVGKVRSHLELLDLLHRPQGSGPGSDPAILDADVAQVALQVVLLFVHVVALFLAVLGVLVGFLLFILSIEFFFLVLTVLLLLQRPLAFASLSIFSSYLRVV